jgi:hypothetical protein
MKKRGGLPHLVRPLFRDYRFSDLTWEPVMIWSLDWKTVKKPSRPGLVNGIKKVVDQLLGKSKAY